MIGIQLTIYQTSVFAKPNSQSASNDELGGELANKKSKPKRMNLEAKTVSESHKWFVCKYV